MRAVGVSVWRYLANLAGVAAAALAMVACVLGTRMFVLPDDLPAGARLAILVGVGGAHVRARVGVARAGGARRAARAAAAALAARRDPGGGAVGMTRMQLRIAVVVAVAALLIGGLVALAADDPYRLPRSAMQVAPPPAAALYVAPNGSDVSDCRSPSAPCASFDRAYHLAAPGAVVEIAGGGYPPQLFSEDPSKTSPDDVVLKAAAGREGRRSAATDRATASPRRVRTT